LKEIKDNAAFIDADGLEKDCIDVLEKISKETDKLAEMGIKF
jgi:hypothetical protein